MMHETGTQRAAWVILALLCLTPGCRQRSSIADVDTESGPKKAGIEAINGATGDDQDGGQDSSLVRVTDEPKCSTYKPFPAGVGTSLPNAGGESLIFCAELFTGYDGKNKYAVVWDVLSSIQNPGAAPTPVPFLAPPIVEVDDKSLLDIRIVGTPTFAQPDPSIAYIEMTTKKAGTAWVTVRSNGLLVSCKVNIQSYTPEQNELGRKRYTAPDSPADDRAACTSCHNVGSGATGRDLAPNHDPWTQAYDPDDTLRLGAAFGKGCDDDGKPYEKSAFGVHKFHFTKEELEALPAYLRSLKTFGFP